MADGESGWDGFAGAGGGFAGGAACCCARGAGAVERGSHRLDRGRRRRGARADLHEHLRRMAEAVGIIAQQLADPLVQVLADPLHHEAIRREQAQHAVGLDRLQRPHPDVEQLLRDLGLELAQAALPQGVLGVHPLP